MLFYSGPDFFLCIRKKTNMISYAGKNHVSPTIKICIIALKKYIIDLWCLMNFIVGGL